MFLSMRRENWAREINLNPTHHDPGTPGKKSHHSSGQSLKQRHWKEVKADLWKGSFSLKVSELLHQISMAGKNGLLNKVRWQLKKQWRKAVGRR